VALESDSRKVGDGERWILVEVIGLDEALKQVPTHLELIIGNINEETDVFMARRSGR